MGKVKLAPANDVQLGRVRKQHLRASAATHDSKSLHCQARALGLIEEVRRPAPYAGGPTGLVSLDRLGTKRRS
jgi:hypothetical protein